MHFENSKIITRHFFKCDCGQTFNIQAPSHFTLNHHQKVNFSVHLEIKMIFQIFLLDVKGKVLIFRNYRGEIDSNVIDKFMPLLMEKGEFAKMKIKFQ